LAPLLRNGEKLEIEICIDIIIDYYYSVNVEPLLLMKFAVIYAFDSEINKTLRQIRQRKKREQKIRAAKKNSGATMADENLGEHENHQPRRILGNYAL